MTPSLPSAHRPGYRRWAILGVTLLALLVALAVLFWVLLGRGQPTPPGAETQANTQALTVAEVWENAQALNGTQIRVRGRSHVYTEPYVGLIGCPPGDSGVVVGTMVLLPGGDTNNPSSGIAISASSLQCKGNHCLITCAPFDPGNMGYCGAFRASGAPAPSAYELVGTLRVSQTDGKTSLVLEDVRLSESRRLIKETWEPIPTATVEYGCP